MFKLLKNIHSLGFMSVLWASLLVGPAYGSDPVSVSNHARVRLAVNQVRLKPAAKLGKKVPSLNLILQTPAETIFVSGSGTPAEAITENTYFRFASNTKNFTAAAILKMHQDGWLNIADRIVGIMPGSQTAYVPRTSHWDVPYKNKITIEQLLRHGAGVYDVDNDKVPGCDGMESFKCCFQAMYDAAYAALETLGYPGKPKISK